MSPARWIIAFIPFAVAAQTADELVARNIAAHGGAEKIKAIRTLRMTGKLQQGNLTMDLTRDAMAPDRLRMSITIQGMTIVQAYDGSVGWQINPLMGRKDPERLGEEDLRDLVEDSDITGPLVDYAAKGNKVEYLGHDTLDGDDVHRLQVTLKNGDILYYYLDPETFLEIRVEKMQHIHGAVREVVADMGSYKLVNGVYLPFTLEWANKQNPNEHMRMTYSKAEANIPIDPAEFQWPGGPQTAEHKEF
jgi:hypothetical protein